MDEATGFTLVLLDGTKDLVSTSAPSLYVPLNNKYIQSSQYYTDAEWYKMQGLNPILISPNRGN